MALPHDLPAVGEESLNIGVLGMRQLCDGSRDLGKFGAAWHWVRDVFHCANTFANPGLATRCFFDVRWRIF